MVIIAGKGYVAPERREEFLASFKDLIQSARTEPGCLDYVVAADPVEAGRVHLFERWESREHLAAHLSGMTPGDPEPSEQVLSMEVAQYEISATGPVGG